MAEQLAEEGVEMSWDTYLVPYGRETSSTVHALNFAARAAMTFGGLTPGDLAKARQILLYNKERVFAFVLALGEVDDQKYATAAGAINFGFPVIADTDIPQILPSGICTYEHVVSQRAPRPDRRPGGRGARPQAQDHQDPDPGARTAPRSRASASARSSCGSSSAASSRRPSSTSAAAS